GERPEGQRGGGGGGGVGGGGVGGGGAARPAAQGPRAGGGVTSSTLEFEPQPENFRRLGACRVAHATPSPGSDRAPRPCATSRPPSAASPRILCGERGPPANTEWRCRPP